MALDTNVFIFALRKEPNYPACETLLFDKLNALQVYMPLQIFLELQRNLTGSEMRRVLRALTMAQAVTWDYAPAQVDLIRQWEQRGAKKGDAVITPTLRRLPSVTWCPRTGTSLWSYLRCPLQY